MKLNLWNDFWPLCVGQCPCDVHFLEYLAEERITGKVIFHFGSGEHHIVGLQCSEREEPNEVLAVTASRQEHEAYVHLITHHPLVARSYKLLFIDIYTLTPRILPAFDLITLFHLGEFYDPSQAAYAPLNDTTLLDLMISRLNPGGRLVFYMNSVGFGVTREILAAATAAGKIHRVGWYKTLLLYAAGPAAAVETEARKTSA